MLWLCQKGADVAALKGDGWRDTALHYAASSGSMECVQALLAFGAEAGLPNALGKPPRRAASCRASRQRTGRGILHVLQVQMAVQRTALSSAECTDGCTKNCTVHG